MNETRPRSFSDCEAHARKRARSESTAAAAVGKVVLRSPEPLFELADKLTPPSETNNKQQEYDEGMFVYRKDYPDYESNLLESVRSAAILYNTGLALLHAASSSSSSSDRSSNYTEAKKWFELASLRLQLNNDDLSNSKASDLSFRIQHNLGYCCYRLGENDKAMRCFRSAALLVGQLSPMHEAATNNCIGVLCFHQEPTDAAQALECFEKCLAVYCQQLPPADPQIATLLNNIGRVHYLQGQYHQALAVYETALHMRRTQPGAAAIDVAATLCNVGQTHHQLGDLDAALQCYQEYLEMDAARSGGNCKHHSADAAVIIKCMAEIHHERREMTKARVLYEEALQAGRQSLGEKHPDLASTLNKLGNLHYEMNHLELALKYYDEGFQIERAVLDPYHPHILVTLMNIAQVYRHQGKFRAALQQYTDVHARTARAYGYESLETANTLSNMALMQYQLRAHDAAFNLYQEALRIQRDIHGSDMNTDVASSLNSIGLVLFQQGVHGLAKDCFYDSLRIRQEVLGADHRDVAILWYNIATIHLESGSDAQAIKYYKETLRIERAALGRTHQDVVLTLQHLGLVHQQRGELEESLVYFEEALEIERLKGEEGKFAVAKLLNLLGNIHLQTANIVKMNDCYAEATRIYLECGESPDSLVIAGYNFYGLSKLHPRSASAA